MKDSEPVYVFFGNRGKNNKTKKKTEFLYTVNLQLFQHQTIHIQNIRFYRNPILNLSYHSPVRLFNTPQYINFHSKSTEITHQMNFLFTKIQLLISFKKVTVQKKKKISDKSSWIQIFTCCTFLTIQSHNIKGL